MSNHEFRRYPQVAYLLMRNWHDRDVFRIYTDRTFALKARGISGVVLEVPLPALETLKVVDA